MAGSISSSSSSAGTCTVIMDATGVGWSAVVEVVPGRLSNPVPVVVAVCGLGGMMVLCHVSVVGIDGPATGWGLRVGGAGDSGAGVAKPFGLLPRFDPAFAPPLFFDAGVGVWKAFEGV